MALARRLVVMDNLSTHKMRAVRAAIAATGAAVLYLPTYSADLNPIERPWADIKRRLRALAITRTTSCSRRLAA